MFGRQMCKNCATGMRCYGEDPLSPFCPYLPCKKGSKCGMYVKIKKKKRLHFPKNIFTSFKF